MAAGKLDFLIEQGASFERTLTIKDSLDAPINLTGYVFSGQIRKKYSDATTVGSFVFTILDQVTNTGKVRVTMSPAATSAIPVDKAETAAKRNTVYVYDIEMNTGSKVERLLEGAATISPEVTR